MHHDPSLQHSEVRLDEQATETTGPQVAPTPYGTRRRRLRAPSGSRFRSATTGFAPLSRVTTSAPPSARTRRNSLKPARTSSSDGKWSSVEFDTIASNEPSANGES
jgi:hypothetical protein